MIDVKQAKEYLKKLRVEEKQICDAATANVKDEILSAAATLAKAEAEQRAAYAETFEQMAIELGKMQRETFLLHVFHGLEVRFAVNHHVYWIEIQTPGSSRESYDNLWLTYARDGQPRATVIDAAWAAIEEHAATVGYEVNRG